MTSAGVATPVLAPALALAATLLVTGALGACKKDRNQVFDSDDQGKLRRIAENLEQAYATAPLPPLTEPPNLLERVDKWDDFRSCTVRTYVARKRDADRRAREGKTRRMRHASIGEETIEECAVQLAVAKKDAEICARLAAEYRGPNGETPLSAVRCWDTRARVFGLPEECPVVWLPHGVLGRNPECLAVARRDQSLCPFAESPGRCRAILTNDHGLCAGPEGAPDCTLAVDYWRGLIPAAFGPPLVDPAALAKQPLTGVFHLRWPKGEHQSLRIEAPPVATVVSWPAGKVELAHPGDVEKFWGYTPPPEAAQLTWNAGPPALKLAFLPGGATAGTRPLAAPAKGAPATFVVVWADDPASFRRCQPGAQTSGEVRFAAGAAQPGSVVEGEIKAQRLACSDGSELDVDGQFRLMILDVR